MKAVERTLQQILHSADQYVIPVFQRYYVWKEDNWDQLWDDLTLLLEMPDQNRRHFMGSIACVPEPPLPGKVPAYLVIDGQQRIITLSVLLCAMRDLAFRLGWEKLAAEVEENYLIHRFKEGREHYKVFPRLRDRQSYLALVDRKTGRASGQLQAAYVYLSKKLEEDSFLTAEKLGSLFATLSTRLDFVVIALEGENPYKIFKSLNSTGVDLEEGDLIRNHVFMRIPIGEQDTFDDQRWRPLERHFEAAGKRNGELDGKLFASFFRDVLMSAGNNVAEYAVYEAFEKAYPFASIKPTDLVADLERQARHHDIIRGKTNHASTNVDLALWAIRSLKATTAYPLVLTLLNAHEACKLSLTDLIGALRAISGFVLRRHVCGLPSNSYGRWFCSACRVLGDSPLANLTAYLTEKKWPCGGEFIPRFQQMNLYKSPYARAVLEGIELSIQAKSEPVGLDECWIDHIMPQSITGDADGKAWRADLGEGWQQVQDAWLHTPGNLTLVGSDYNIAMQKKPFAAKKPVLAASVVYLNKHFAESSLTAWTEETIKARGWRLAKIAAGVWAGPPLGNADAWEPAVDHTIKPAQPAIPQESPPTLDTEETIRKDRFIGDEEEATAIIASMKRATEEMQGSEVEEASDDSKKAHYDVSLSELIHAGLLNVGDKLFMAWKKRVFEGTITARGEIDVLGKTFTSPSHAAIHALQAAGSNRTTENGWKRWKTAGGVLLSGLRDQYLHGLQRGNLPKRRQP